MITSIKDINNQLEAYKKELNELFTDSFIKEMFPLKQVKGNESAVFSLSNYDDLDINELISDLQKAKDNGFEKLEIYAETWDNSVESIDLTAYKMRQETPEEYSKRLSREREWLIQKEIRERELKLKSELKDYLDFERLKKQFNP